MLSRFRALLRPLQGPLFFVVPMLTCAALAVSLGIPRSQAESGESFKTPSGNIACMSIERVLRCDLRENSAPLPPRPRDCEGDFGNAFQMGIKGKSGRICHGDTVFGGNQPVLAYGHTWQYQGFTCVSQMNGLTCRNADKKGWFINKLEQKLF